MEKPRGPMTLLATSQAARWWLIGVAVTLFVVGGFAFFEWRMRQFFRAVLVGETGPVSQRADWPWPLRELLDDSRGIEIDESAIKVHGLCQGFAGEEFVWRMDATPGVFELIEKRWDLVPVEDPKWYKLEGCNSQLSREKTPEWWSPRDDGQTAFYVAREMVLRAENPAGSRAGDQFHVAVDANRNSIWIYYMSPF